MGVLVFANFVRLHILSHPSLVAVLQHSSSHAFLAPLANTPAFDCFIKPTLAALKPTLQP